MNTTPAPLPHPELDAASQPAASRQRLWLTLAHLRTATVSWAIGGFCALVGAPMLIVPHQFASPTFATIRPYMLLVGCLYLLTGGALILTTALTTARWTVRLAHAAAGAVLLLYAWLQLQSGFWAGLPSFAVLGLGTIATGMLATSNRRLPSTGDLFAVLLGLSMLSIGLLQLLQPERFQMAAYDLVRPYLHLFGLAFLGSGLLLLVTNLYRTGRYALLAAHIGASATLLTYMCFVALPARGITGLVFYGGFGLLVLLLPWIGPQLDQFDQRSLRLRLALLFATVAAVPLTLTIALITNQQERLATEQQQLAQQLLAVAQAQEVETYITLHQQAVVSFAGQPDLLTQPTIEQQARLGSFASSYPEIYACMLYDASGRGLARSDDVPPDDAADLRAFDEVRRSGAPALELRISLIRQRPVVLIAAPLTSTTVNFTGMVACGLEATRLDAMVGQVRGGDGRAVYVVDRAGTVIAQTDRSQTDRLISLADRPSIRAFLHDHAPAAALSVGMPPNAVLVGYARVPIIDWGVVVEYPSARALASVWQARELAFGLLVLLTSVAMLIGTLLTRRLTHPLTTLAHAVDQFARGADDAPLPPSGISEVMALAETFGQMRAQLSAAAAAREQAIELRDLFFSVAAHELKTPLTSLMGQAQLLQRRIHQQGDLSERDRRSLEVIVVQAQRLRRLISALLDISRLQHGQLTLARAPLDLDQLVRQVIDEVQPTLDHHTLTYEGAGGALLVDGDGLRLEQVLHNLISNAIKYSPDGGEVQVRAERRDGQARIVISDQGMGVPAAALPHLFQRFYRAPNVIPNQIAGMGVGLYVVAEIVSLHSGSITVESAEGQGSSFTIELPLCGAP